MESFFKYGERGLSFGTEVRAGLTHVPCDGLASSPSTRRYSPAPASTAARPPCATCLGAGIMTICMGIFANRPPACASGLGINAMVAGITATRAAATARRHGRHLP